MFSSFRTDAESFPRRMAVRLDTCTEVLFKLGCLLTMISKYAKPLLLPTSREKPGYAAGRSIRERV
jgi:hypothetical protein